jgi:curved DNA-binding protein CbpA
VGSDTYYDILGVSPAASPDEIRAQYRSLLHRIHPDRDGPAALFRQVQEAYEVLSDPARRRAYDRFLAARGGATSMAEYQAGPHRVSASGPRRRPSRTSVFTSVWNRHPAGTIAMAGAVLLLFGAALAQVGIALILLGSMALFVACVAGLGGRGAKEREAYQRSGMTAVDAMNGRQFEVLLENFFANKGYRVGRIGSRGELGADLLLNDAQGRMIVQARRWTGVVRHEAVQHAVVAMARYGADRALVVTPSDYSEQAVTAAHSSGVTLWNRATLAAELTVFRGERYQPGITRLSDQLRAGSRIALGLFAALYVALVAMSTKKRRVSSPPSR